ncbi:uncharacterized protein Triagg1_10990 [Trichoderma aggressivum f. europaeum]|uniref:Uncharacterized protein n=1 Tax=Trichoderma aggressivum f. europaeum TaxID=173218 RepID=A0AAE1I566_9HYPO|nr:hypothetical protein Triagg1_10990 [Trichoderma aggressivum f. europaeum]
MRRIANVLALNLPASRGIPRSTPPLKPFRLVAEGDMIPVFGTPPPESRRALRRHYVELARQSNTHHTSLERTRSLSYSLRWAYESIVAIQPAGDLVMLRVAPGSLWPLRKPPMSLSFGDWMTSQHVGLEYDAGWIAGLQDATFQSLLQEETPRGFLNRTAVGANHATTVLWLVDQTIERTETTAADGRNDLCTFHGGGSMEFVEGPRDLPHGSGLTTAFSIAFNRKLLAFYTANGLEANRKRFNVLPRQQITCSTPAGR